MEGYKDCHFSEIASGVVFESSNEQKRFYLAGDTIFCQKVIDTIKKFQPEVVAVNAAGVQFPLGHLLIMNQYDVRALMRQFPELDVIATHVEGVSHATVTRAILKEFAEKNNLKRLHIPKDGELLEF